MTPVSPQLDAVDLSVVLPCYNENPHIESIVESWREELSQKGISYEVLAINDGSLDGTGRILDKLRKDHKEIRVVHQLNMGHSRACRRGLEMARGRYVLFVSANGRFEPSDFSVLWELREGHPLVLGKRTHRLDGFFSKAFTGLLRFLSLRLFKVKLEDPGIPFRLCLRKPALSVLNQIPADWQSLHWMMTILTAQQLPGTIVEAKIPYRHRLERQSPFRRTGFFQLAFTYSLEALSLRFRTLKSKGLDLSLPSADFQPI